MDWASPHFAHLPEPPSGQARTPWQPGCPQRRGLRGRVMLTRNREPCWRPHFPSLQTLHLGLFAIPGGSRVRRHVQCDSVPTQLRIPVPDGPLLGCAVEKTAEEFLHTGCGCCAVEDPIRWGMLELPPEKMSTHAILWVKVSSLEIIILAFASVRCSDEPRFAQGYCIRSPDR